MFISVSALSQSTKPVRPNLQYSFAGQISQSSADIRPQRNFASSSSVMELSLSLLVILLSDPRFSH